jgi:hypothetical protein
MIRRNTWIVLAVLLVLIGASFYSRDLKAREAAAATPTQGPAALFKVAEGAPTDIKIVSSVGTIVQFARDQSGKWVLKAPAEAPADQAAAEAAATQVGSLQVVSSVDLGADVIGLDKPSYTITIGYGSSRAHTLLVGSVTPIQNGYYARLDGGQSQIVDKGGLDALLGLLTRPPYLNTPTPVASETPTSEPGTAAASPADLTATAQPSVAPAATP